MQQIQLTKGKIALVDDDDYEWLSKINWYYHRYCMTHFRINGKRRTILMHRAIMGCTCDEKVDHINRDTCDNRRENLRIATTSQNAGNSVKHKDNKSGFKGLVYRCGRWQVYCKEKYLGTYSTAEEAQEVYMAAAINNWGEFARCS